LLLLLAAFVLFVHFGSNGFETSFERRKVPNVTSETLEKEESLPLFLVLALLFVLSFLFLFASLLFLCILAEMAATQAE